MWQDGVALLIVIVAALVLLRRYVPSGWSQAGARREDEAVAGKTVSTSACGSCGAQAGCGRVKHWHQGTD
jgi:hypothetical protein